MAILIALALFALGFLEFLNVLRERKHAALVAFRQVERFSIQGDWKSAFRLTSSRYKSLANEVNFRGDFGFLTNGASQFQPVTKLAGGAHTVEIRRTFSIDATSGLAFEMVHEDGRWVIDAPPARWTNTDW